ncbi:MAG: ATP phosphoribosyltransferase [Anaerolineales bacterium]|nr:ATP phosphoribosyltransferase [Anaerolineales bacterium]
MPETNINIPRISLPSKGRLAEAALAFLDSCGLSVYKPNPRQYEAVIPALPELCVLFQRPGDIVASVQDGSVDFGITGLDVVEEHKNGHGDLVILHEALNFGNCILNLAIPEAWEDVTSVSDLTDKVTHLKRPLRIATKYPNLTGKFLKEHDIPHTLISAEGTLETAPAIGYADLICDVVSSGQTLRDNRLRPLSDGKLLTSQVVLIANTHALKINPKTLNIARTLLEFFEGHLRARENLAVFANMRGTSPEAIAELLFNRCNIHGLQGPTISRVIVQEGDPNWYAVNIIVQRSQIFQAINELRAIGGSGVVVMPISYIFDEEPPRYTRMLQILEAYQGE